MAIKEDDPNWNWATMGNRHRAVTLKSGKRVSVGPVAFSKLRKSRRIDNSKTPRMKGDYDPKGIALSRLAAKKK